MSDPFLGEIRMFAGTFAPRGWAFCNGQLLSIQSNQALFAIIGTTYGGNGQTTFALPDLCGRVPTGQGQGIGEGAKLPVVGIGQVGGAPTTTLTVNQLPAHAPTATFAGTLSDVTVSIPVGTDSTSEIANPTANGTSYLTATSAAFGREPVTINGLYASSAPAKTAHLGGVTAATTANGTVTIEPIGSNQPFSNAQPYLGVNFIIALLGEFPMRN